MNFARPLSFQIKKTHIALAIAVLLGGWSQSRADIAVLQEVGPESEALGANPGALDSKHPEIKMNMEKAEVLITLSKADGDLLHAKFEARFAMQNLEREGGPESQCVVAFPATGLDANLLTISNFHVTINGSTPPTILRRTVAVSRREVRQEDTPLFGKWDASYEPETKDGKRSRFDSEMIKLRQGKFYANSYLWLLRSKPGSSNEIVVTYEADIRLQSVSYRKEYSNGRASLTSIPFRSFPLRNDPKGYYLFDYVLRSGSTWFGPIGKETITIAFDPSFSKSNQAIEIHKRTDLRDSEYEENRISNLYLDENAAHGKAGEIIYELSGRPDFDLLISVAKSRIE